QLGALSGSAVLDPLPSGLTPHNKDVLVELGSRFAENQRLGNAAMVQDVLQQIAQLSGQGLDVGLAQLGIQLDAAQLAGDQATADALVRQITEATGVPGTSALLTSDVVDRLRQTGVLSGAVAAATFAPSAPPPPPAGPGTPGFIGGNVGPTGMRPFSGGLPALPGVITPQQVPTFTQPTLSQPTAGGGSRFGSQVHVTVNVQQSPLTRMDHEDIARQLAPAIQQELNRQRF
ncbi:MAG TPA: hypothetical protein VNM37_05800, partial [Candidatus Dormibacteraeota bacterium]|nr:hypothetical protein [Candidatus Dormibacteraeota bacterium]